MKELHIYTYDVPFEVHSRGYCEEHAEGEGVLNTYDVGMFTLWEAEYFNDVYIHWIDTIDGNKYCSISAKAMVSEPSPYFGNKRITYAHNLQRLFGGYIWGPLHRNDAV